MPGFDYNGDLDETVTLRQVVEQRVVDAADKFRANVRAAVESASEQATATNGFLANSVYRSLRDAVNDGVAEVRREVSRLVRDTDTTQT